MMPECSHKDCKKVAKHYLGKIRISLNDDWENPLYLCEKHTKEFIKKYGIGGCE